MNLIYPITVAYGGGVNSTAMLAGFAQREIVPSLITFADTGGERPETYEHVQIISDWCVKTWGIQIEVVRKLYQGQFEGLEKNCLRKSMLPSLAYGRKGCSLKYKVEPQNTALAKWMKDHQILHVTRAIGYDAMEGHRAVKTTGDQIRTGRSVSYWYPLIDWQLSRSGCRDLITSQGLPIPPKSACFFCPASKRKEISQLPADLYARAIAIEEKAQATTKLGLGRDLHWRNVAKDAEVWDWIDDHDKTQIPCGCFDESDKPE